MQVFPVEQAIRAQKALPEASGLKPEQFRIQAFVGMISDEVEQLRHRGKSDQEIAVLIAVLIGAKSSIRITASQITENYASPKERHQDRHVAPGE